jgi:hypothetical protein
VGPDEPFEFLGYRFRADGGLDPPPSIPAVLARRMVEFARSYARQASVNINSGGRKTIDAASRTAARLKERFRRRMRGE